jgi:hypothetical protein
MKSCFGKFRGHAESSAERFNNRHLRQEAEVMTRPRRACGSDNAIVGICLSRRERPCAYPENTFCMTRIYGSHTNERDL